MAQGLKKLGSAKKSAGAQKRKTQAKKKLSKGRKEYSAKGRKAIAARQDVATTKAINNKNESLVSARAIGAGSRFFLSDIKDKGKKELDTQKRTQTKKEDKSVKLSDKLRDQLKKLGKDV